MRSPPSGLDCRIAERSHFGLAVASLNHGQVDGRRNGGPGFLKRLKAFQGLVKTALQVGLVALDLVQGGVIGKTARYAAALQGGLVSAAKGLVTLLRLGGFGLEALGSSYRASEQS